MKTIGYLRVSTTDQDTEKNRDEVLRLANEKKLGTVEWVSEEISGTVPWRNRQLGQVIDRLQKGDRLVTNEFSRLARSTLQILEIIETCKRKGIDVYVVKGNWSINGGLNSKVMLLALSMVSEIERELISLRTKEGLAAARAKGRQIGRPKGPGKSKLDPYRPEIEALLRDGSTQAYVAKRYHTTGGNLINWLRMNQIDAKPIYPELGKRV